MSRRRRQARIAPSHPVSSVSGNRPDVAPDGSVQIVRREDGPIARDPRRRSRRSDGWYSLVSALGTDADKITQHRFRADRNLQPEECSALYHGDDLAATICDALPTDALRQPVKIVVSEQGKGERSTAGAPEPKGPRPVRPVREDGADADDGTAIATSVQMALRELGAQEKIAEAAIWGRVFGGAALLLGTDDGQPHQPLNLAGVDRLRFLRVLDRRSLVPTIWYSDPSADDKFGQPMIYRVFTPSAGARAAAAGVMVHESRLVMFGGALTAETERVRNAGWDHSVLQRVWAVLQQTNHAWQAINHMVGNSSQAILAIKNLFGGASADGGAIEDGDKDVLIDRLEIMQLLRLMKIMPIDTEERFEYVEQTFSGLEGIITQIFQRLAAAARMPLTRLVGMSPAGMNATGEADRWGWYDQVRAYQVHDLKPAIERVVEVLFASHEGPTEGVEPEEWDIDFDLLWQPTPLEQSSLRAQDATADATRITSGVLTPDEVANSRYRPEGYGSEIQLDREARDQAKREQTPPSALNRDQVTAIVDVVSKVAAGELPRDAGVAMVAAATGQDTDAAEKLVGAAGTEAFEPKPKALPFGQGQPAPGPTPPEEPAPEPAPDPESEARTKALAERLAAARREKRAA